MSGWKPTISLIHPHPPPHKPGDCTISNYYRPRPGSVVVERSPGIREARMVVVVVVVSQFNGTSTPKGSYRAKTGDNDCNVNSSRYSLSTALCESNSLSGQVWIKCPTRPDTQGRHVEAALMHPLMMWETYKATNGTTSNSVSLGYIFSKVNTFIWPSWYKHLIVVQIQYHNVWKLWLRFEAAKIWNKLSPSVKYCTTFGWF